MSVELRRSLSLWQVTASGVGIVIGAGIYVLIGPATQEAGSAVWISFLIAGLLSALTGLSYAELAGMFPSAGAEYSFARHAFNELVGFLVGWLMIAANVIAAGAVAIGFAHYAGHFVSAPARLLAIGLVAILSIVIVSGIGRSIWFSVVLAIVQVAGLLLVISAGAPHVGSRDLLADASLAGVMGGAALIFFAFIGFDEIVTLSEETHDAGRVIPRALLIALGVCSVLYVLVALASVSVLGAAAIAESKTPLTEVISHDWGSRAGDIVAAIALASTTNTTLLMLTAASRLLYRMSRDEALPGIFARVSSGPRAPWIAGLTVGALAIAFAAVADIALIAAVTDFAVYTIFIVVNAALIALRYRAAEVPRAFSTPFSIGRIPILPVLGGAGAALMATQLEPGAWIIGLSTIALGLAAWIVIRRANRHANKVKA
jgi:APA family basic amino acid/polyamine antiporter